MSKKILILLVALLVPAASYAQTVGEDLVGLGMSAELADYLEGIIPAGAALDNNVYLKGNNQAGSADINLIKVDTSDNTVINSSASDDLILQLEDDANRTLKFDAASDTALVLTFGDGTASQTFSILGAAATDSLILGANAADITITDNLVTVASGTSVALTSGNLTFAATNTGVASTTAGTVTAAGTTVTDATQLAAVWNVASTVGANTGVKLWDTSNGIQICVQNAGANNLELYPPTSGATINAAAAGAGITLAAATDDIACCVEVASTQWVCTVDPGPAT